MKNKKLFKGLFIIGLVGASLFPISGCDDNNPASNLTVDKYKDERSDAKVALETYKSTNLYRNEEKELLLKAISDGKKAIDSATDLIAIEKALEDAKKVIDNIKTDNDLYLVELEAILVVKKEEAKEELETYKNSSLYRDNEKLLLEKAINDGKTSIDNATTEAKLEVALNNAKATMDAIKTDAQLDQEELEALENRRIEAKEELENYKSLDLYRDAEKELVRTAVSNGKSNIDNATSISQVNTALSNAKSVIDSIKTDLEYDADESQALLDAKDSAKEELENYKSLDLYRDAEKELITTTINNGKVAIDNATTLNGVSAALVSYKAQIDNIKTDADYLLEAEALYNAKQEAKSNILDYAPAEEYTINITQYTSALNNAYSLIDSATSIDDVNTKLVEAKALFDSIDRDDEALSEGNYVRANGVYMTFNDAINEYQTGDYSGAYKIVLISNVTIDSQIILDKSIEIEGQDRYSITSSDSFTDSSMFISKENSTGVFTFKNVEVDANKKSRIITIGYGKLVINGADLTGGYTPYSTYASGVYITNNGSFEMTSGSIYGNDSQSILYYSEYSQDLWIGANATGSLVSISGGHISNVFVNANSYSSSNPGGFTLDGGIINNLYVEYDDGYGASFTYNSGSIDHLYIATYHSQIDSGYYYETIPTPGNVYRGGERSLEFNEDAGNAGLQSIEYVKNNLYNNITKLGEKRTYTVEEIETLFPEYNFYINIGKLSNYGTIHRVVLNNIEYLAVDNEFRFDIGNSNYIIGKYFYVDNDDLYIAAAMFITELFNTYDLFINNDIYELAIDSRIIINVDARWNDSSNNSISESSEGIFDVTISNSRDNLEITYANISDDDIYLVRKEYSDGSIDYGFAKSSVSSYNANSVYKLNPVEHGIDLTDPSNKADLDGSYVKYYSLVFKGSFEDPKAIKFRVNITIA